MSEPKLVMGREVLKALAPTLGLDMLTVRRIVIDIPYDDLPTVFIEQMGDSRLISIDWPGHLKDVKVVKE